MSSVNSIPEKYPNCCNAPKSIAESPMRVPTVTTFSFVKKTPKGMFWIGKSLFSGTSIHDFLLVSLADIGILC